jgi:hypothetical protein
MNDSFWEWYEKVLGVMRWSLEPYSFEERGTGNNDKFRAFYKVAGGDKKNKGFIVHLRPAPTLNKINIDLGSAKVNLKIPNGYPDLRHADNKNQCQFDIFFEKPNDWPLVFLLAVQVAEIRSKELSD